MHSNTSKKGVGDLDFHHPDLEFVVRAGSIVQVRVRRPLVQYNHPGPVTLARDISTDRSSVSLMHPPRCTHLSVCC